jgi:hypothetical protein
MARGRTNLMHAKAMKKLKNLSLGYGGGYVVGARKRKKGKNRFSFLFKMNTLIHMYLFIYLYKAFVFLLNHKNATLATKVLDSPTKN